MASAYAQFPANKVAIACEKFIAMVDAGRDKARKRVIARHKIQYVTRCRWLDRLLNLVPKILSDEEAFARAGDWDEDVMTYRWTDSIRRERANNLLLLARIKMREINVVNVSASMFAIISRHYTP